ncbi:glycogen branching enzyme [Bacillus sp. SG-1]|nr:glycogen branching enzyme [Bacillus sp. SG-1]
MFFQNKRVSISKKVEEVTERTPERTRVREDVSDGTDEEIRSLVEAETITAQ